MWTLVCLDVDTIVAFVEGRLPADQRLTLEQHVGTCDSCREQLSLALAASVTAEVDGPPLDPGRPALAVGAQVGRYTVLGLVGSGGMGEVYAAYDPELDRKVALKILRDGASGPDAGGKHRAHDRLLREAKAIAKLRHPSVVVIHDAGTVEGRVFLAMEFVEGMTLREWLAERPRPPREILDIFIAAGRGLAAAHAAGLVHRDFKPANVMVSSDGGVRVMDFGLVRSLAEEAASEGAASLANTLPDDADLIGSAALTRTGELLGTPLYMAPEQFQASRTDARTDQFAFCVALYEALFGVRPFAGTTLATLMASVVEGRVSPPVARTSVRPAIRRAVLRGLRVTPDERWPSMDALLAALTRDPFRRRVLPLAAVCLTVALVGGIWARGERRPASLCRAGATKLAGVWELPTAAGDPTPRRTAIHDAFLKTGAAGAAEVWQRTAERLDRYAGQWLGAYADACEATHVRGEQSAEVLDLRMTCLSERLTHVQALTSVFVEATPTVVSNAITAVAALPSLDRCADSGLLRAVVPPPEDRETRDRVAVLKRELARVRALGDSGQCTAAAAAWHALVDQARQVGYGPLEAESLMALAASASECEEAADMLTASKRAALTALAARDDETAAAAAVLHAHWLADRTSDVSGARDWIDLGETILKRLPKRPPALEAWRLGALARTFEKEGDVQSAWNTFQQQLAFIARTEGPEHLDYMKALNNAAVTAETLGRFDQALQYLLRAEGLAEKLLGPHNVYLALQLDNAAEALNALHRFDEARASAARALDIYRSFGSTAFYEAVSLTLLGEAWLGLSRPEQARPVLDQAVRAFGADRSSYRWQAAFGLARALPETPADREHARSLGRQARDGFVAAGDAQQAKVVDAWLAGTPIRK